MGLTRNLRPQIKKLSSIMCGWQPLMIERETREEGLKKEQVHEDQGDKINAG